MEEFDVRKIIGSLGETFLIDSSNFAEFGLKKSSSKTSILENLLATSEITSRGSVDELYLPRSQLSSLERTSKFLNNSRSLDMIIIFPIA